MSAATINSNNNNNNNSNNNNNKNNHRKQIIVETADNKPHVGVGGEIIVGDRIEWSRATILGFIEDYRRERVLWDPNCKGYHIKQTKYEALKALGHKYGTEIRAIRSKIKSLRSSFHREHGKVINGRRKGLHYQPMWFAYEAIRFILDNDHETTNTNTNTNNVNNNNININTNIMPNDAIISTMVMPKKPPTTTTTTTKLPIFKVEHQHDKLSRGETSELELERSSGPLISKLDGDEFATLLMLARQKTDIVCQTNGSNDYRNQFSNNNYNNNYNNNNHQVNGQASDYSEADAEDDDGDGDGDGYVDDDGDVEDGSCVDSDESENDYKATHKSLLAMSNPSAINTTTTTPSNLTTLTTTINSISSNSNKRARMFNPKTTTTATATAKYACDNHHAITAAAATATTTTTIADAVATPPPPPPPTTTTLALDELSVVSKVVCV